MGLNESSRRHNLSLMAPKNELNINAGPLFVSSLRETIICLSVSVCVCVRGWGGAVHANL